MTIPVRLAKRIVEIAACSRREAELYIAGGWVSVDGVVVEEPQFMVGQQKVELHPAANLTPVVPVTILFNHPLEFSPEQQLIQIENRAAEDHSGIRPLKQHFVRLTQCLPLEAGANGMAVFTQDFHVSRKLSEDAATIEQEYVVEVAGEPITDGLKLLNHGLGFNGKALPPVKVSWQSEARLRFALKGVQPGQIAHMCRSVGLQVLSVRRLRIGRLSMGKLPPGQWRYMLPYERF
ncbi:MAG: RNA-binding protein [Gallionellaceae bacterium]|nr:MAG: RNA-binding protein [Gallionellaceae bacterium]